MKIHRDRELGTIHLSQPSFINTIAKRFDITPGRQISLPMDPLIELRTEVNTSKNTMDIGYASLIGSINYCAISTQPDISYATTKSAQFTFNPTIVHWEAARPIDGCVLYNKDYGMLYSPDGRGIEGYGHNLTG